MSDYPPGTFHEDLQGPDIGAGKAAHTPGPWYAGEHGPYLCVTAYADDCAIAVMDDESAVGEANARLIAAAPDLLAALKGLLGDEAWLQKPYRAALKYICVHCGRDYYGSECDETLPDHCSDDCPGEIARAAISKATGAK